MISSTAPFADVFTAPHHTFFWILVCNHRPVSLTSPQILFSLFDLPRPTDMANGKFFKSPLPCGSLHWLPTVPFPFSPKKAYQFPPLFSGLSLLSVKCSACECKVGGKDLFLWPASRPGFDLFVHLTALIHLEEYVPFPLPCLLFQLKAFNQRVIRITPYCLLLLSTLPAPAASPVIPDLPILFICFPFPPRETTFLPHGPEPCFDDVRPFFSCVVVSFSCLLVRRWGGTNRFFPVLSPPTSGAGWS